MELSLELSLAAMADLASYSRLHFSSLGGDIPAISPNYKNRLVTLTPTSDHHPTSAHSAKSPSPKNITLSDEVVATNVSISIAHHFLP